MSKLDLKKLIAAANDSDKIITGPFEEWLMAHSDEAVDSEVAEWISKQLQTTPRDRSASFSASAGGTCIRAQELQFLGVQQVGGVDPRLANIFNDGKWRHLRWQALLIMAGLIDEGEFPLFWRNRRLRGTADGTGTVWDSHVRRDWRGKWFGFELKGVNPYIYQKVMKNDEEIKYEHLRQVHRYFLMGGFDLFVIIYENKGTQEFHEWVIEPDEKILKEQSKELDKMNRDVERKKLAKKLPSCQQQFGQTFNDCGFGGKGGPCVRAGNWPVLKKNGQVK